MGFENKTGLQLRSLLKKSSELELSLVKIAIPEPAADEVVVRVEATPINPSDLGLLLGAADIKTAKLSGRLWRCSRRGNPASPPVATASLTLDHAVRLPRFETSYYQLHETAAH